MNKFKIIGVLILAISVAYIIIFDFSNDVLDFITGMFMAVGIAFTFGILPKKKQNKK
mgnify:FL=1